MDLAISKKLDLEKLPFSVLDIEKQIVSDNKSVKSDRFWISKHFFPGTHKPFQWFIKRCFDISASTLGLIAISPLLLAIIIAIKVESKGPLIFKQKRLGKNGREFYMYKFRSMVIDAEEKLVQLKDKNETNSAMFKMFDDPRVTKVGKFIRKFSLDELPQIINVLKGDMSLIGPRPPIRRELSEYKNWHYIRFSTLPGLTGLWQVSGRSNISNFDDVVKLDYTYISNWNLLLDFKILLKTIPVVLFAKDAA